MQRTLRDHGEKSIAPNAAETDQTGKFPTESVRELARHGLLGVPISTKFCGAGGGFLSYAVVAEELSRGCANTAFI